MKKIIFFLAAAVFVSVSALYADGGTESYMSIIVDSQTKDAFTVEKNVLQNEDEAAIKRKFTAQKIDFTYTVKFINGDKDEESEIGTISGKGAIPAGKDKTVISASAWVKELGKKINRRGRVEITVTTSAVSGFDSMYGSDSIDVYNEQYQKELIGTAMQNPQLMESFASDYQNFMMQNAGKDQKQINKEFLKKYPQYKSFLPEQ